VKNTIHKRKKLDLNPGPPEINLNQKKNSSSSSIFVVIMKAPRYDSKFMESLEYHAGLPKIFSTISMIPEIAEKCHG